MKILLNPIKDIADINRIARNGDFGTNCPHNTFNQVDVIAHIPVQKFAEQYGKANIDVALQTDISKPYGDFRNHGFLKRYKAKHSTQLSYLMFERMIGTFRLNSYPTVIEI